MNSIYEKRADDKRLPADLLYFKKQEEEKSINDLFRLRKAESFFIEDNQELFNLHLYAAKTYKALFLYDSALNHYFQCLQYKKLEYEKDDSIFYEISQIFKKLNHFNAYISSLEAAYSLNSKNYDYSLELGKALTITNHKKKAIYHLERYLGSKGDESVDPELFLIIGNLNEDINKYIETVKYYKKYVERKKDDGYIYFALGYLAYKNVGDFNLANECFSTSLELLPENDLFRRSKASEYLGDIQMMELNFAGAAEEYLATLSYQEKIKAEMKEKNDEILKIKDKMKEIKSSLNREKIYDKYNEYQALNNDLGKLNIQNREKKYSYEKLNAGKIRWNLAESYERMDQLNEAVKYFREAIAFNYNSNKARNKIMKLKLKIKRGY